MIGVQSPVNARWDWPKPPKAWSNCVDFNLFPATECSALSQKGASWLKHEICSDEPQTQLLYAANKRHFIPNTQQKRKTHKEKGHGTRVIKYNTAYSQTKEEKNYHWDSKMEKNEILEVSFIDENFMVNQFRDWNLKSLAENCTGIF